jgi:outer membrane immunogenic protein
MTSWMRNAAAGVLVFSLSGPVLAADMPRKALPYAPMPFFSWTGFYAGVNAGYGFGRVDSTYTLDVLGLLSIPLASDSLSPQGFIAGGQIGYNFQTGAFVWGVEADIQYSAQRDTGSFICPGLLCAPAGLVGLGIDHTEKIDWFGTARLRLGYAFDRWLVYGTGGVAYASLTSEVTATTPLASVTFSNSVNRAGWTVGAGVENAFARNWSWKLEYLYMDFGTFTINNALGLPVVLATTINQEVRFTNQVVRVGLNYRF